MLSNSIMCKVCVTGELLKVDLKHKCLALYFLYVSLITWTHKVI